jgi:hypothetical protein
MRSNAVFRLIHADSFTEGFSGGHSGAISKREFRNVAQHLRAAATHHQHGGDR